MIKINIVLLENRVNLISAFTTSDLQVSVKVQSSNKKATQNATRISVYRIKSKALVIIQRVQIPCLSFKSPKPSDVLSDLIFKDNSPMNLKVLRKFASQDQYARLSEKSIIFIAALDSDFFLKVIFEPLK